MSEDQRRRAFALSAAVIALVIAILWLLSPSGSSRTGSRSRSNAAMHPAGAPPAPRHRGLVVGGANTAAASGTTAPRSPVPAAPNARLAALDDARRFAVAFTHYEVGDLSPAIRRAIRMTATPGFATQLLGAPPSMPAGTAPVHRATVTSVSFAGIQPSNEVAIAVGLERGGRPSPMTLLLTRAGDGWRVSALH